MKIKSNSPHCLVVTKDRLFADLLRFSWQRAGLTVTSCESFAFSGPLDAEAFDIVLLDNGVEAAGEMLHSEWLKGTQVLFLVDESSDIPRNLPANVTAYPRTGPLEQLLLVVRARLELDVSLPDDQPGIIVADDDDQTRRLIIRLLESRGYLAVGATDGRAALELAEDKRFRLILADVNMPPMGGIEMLNELMKRRHPPAVIVLSGVADSEVARHAIELGAFDYILKPFAPNELESSISACISHKQYRNSIWRRLAQWA